MNVVLLDTDPFAELFGDSKPSVPIEFKHDPLALSCGAWRLKTYMDIENIPLETQDYELADKVRQHFMNKLVMQRLKTERISSFRQKVGAFLAGNVQLTKDDIGLLYHLPHFYFEDLAVQKLIDDTAEVTPAVPKVQTVHLKPYTKIELKRRIGAIRQYWWTDSDRRPYCLSVKENTQNQSLYQSIWNFAGIDVEAHMYPKVFGGTDQRFFYKLVSPKLLGVSNS